MMPSDHPPRGATSTTRRELLVGALGFGVAATLPMAATALSSPYPIAKGLGLVRQDSRWLWRNGCGSDQWPHVAISQDTILGAWGDGFGWTKGAREAKSFLGLTTIGGSPERPAGSDRWADAGDLAAHRARLKPCALIKTRSGVALYATGDGDGRDATRLLTGSAGGDFRLASGEVVSRSRHGLQVVGTVHHPVGGDGDLILLLATDGNLKGAKLYSQRSNPRIWAARVPPTALGDIDRWEWFAGLAGGRPVWSKAVVRSGRFAVSRGPAVRPVFEDGAGSGKHVMISWCHALKGYVLAKTQAKTQLALMLAPTPFGPWRTLYYGPFVTGDAAGKATIFTAQVVQMWSRDGSVAVLWSGYPGISTTCTAPRQETNYDAVYLTRFGVRR